MQPLHMTQSAPMAITCHKMCIICPIMQMYLKPQFCIEPVALHREWMCMLLWWPFMMRTKECARFTGTSAVFGKPVHCVNKTWCTLMSYRRNYYDVRAQMDLSSQPAYLPNQLQHRTNRWMLWSLIFASSAFMHAMIEHLSSLPIKETSNNIHSIKEQRTK